MHANNVALTYNSILFDVEVEVVEALVDLDVSTCLYSDLAVAYLTFCLQLSQME
jgi:hypothetical protein